MPKIKEVTAYIPEGYFSLMVTPEEMVVILNALVHARRSLSDYDDQTIERFLSSYEPILGVLGIEFDGADYLLADSGLSDLPVEKAIIGRIRLAMQTAGVKHDELA